MNCDPQSTNRTAPIKNAPQRNRYNLRMVAHAFRLRLTNLLVLRRIALKRVGVPMPFQFP